MKKLLSIICIFTVLSSFAQKSDSTNTPITSYGSISISMTNSDNFKKSSYTSIEGGIMKGKVGVGAMLGRGSLYGLGSKTDNIQNYFYEVKTFVSFPVDNLSAGVLFGYGGYFNTSHNFIEYGATVAYNVRNLSYGMTCSNWDGITYVTPSITYNF